MIITISNHLHLSRIHHDLKQQIADGLTMTNPKWINNKRMGRRNYNVPRELFFYKEGQKGSLIVPRGLFSDIVTYCEKNKFHYTINHHTRKVPAPIPFELQAALHSFQREAREKILAKNFGTLCAPTGSGKTVIALSTIPNRNQNTIVIVHTSELADQWALRAEQFLGVKRVGKIGGGKLTVEPLTIAMVQTLYKHAASLRDDFGYVIVDECHRCPSRLFTEAVTAFDSEYMLGLSATPYRSDGLSDLVGWYLGGQVHNIELSDLTESGDVLPLEVRVRDTDFDIDLDPVSDYSKVLSELTLDDDRNRLIISDVIERSEKGEVCLILTDRKHHCELLRWMLEINGHKSCVLTGSVKKSEREKIVKKLNQGDVKILIATGQLIGEGFDCPKLESLFLATPLKFSGRVIQYIGRVRRPGNGRTKAFIYDYADWKVGVLGRSARTRMKIYNENK